MHVAIRIPAGWSTVCGRTLRRARVIPEEDASRGPVCPDCREAGQHARTLRELYLIAGW